MKKIKLTSKLKKQLIFFQCMLFLTTPNFSHAFSVKSYSYNRYGNLQEIVDPRGFSTQYQFDCLNRLEQITFPDGKAIRYSYDSNGTRIKMEDPHGITLFEPNEFGQVTKVTFPDGQSVAYQYDMEGNLTKLTYPNGIAVEYSYDLSNRLESIKAPSGTTKFEYDEASNSIKKKTLPNGVSAEFQYYPSRKISHITHRKANGSLIEEIRYVYDENGNRSKIEKVYKDKHSHVNYTYDKLNRVIRADYSDGFFEAFSYDGAGNRQSKTTPRGVVLYEYDEENRLKKAGDTTYTYDAAGNLIEKSSPKYKTTYTYDFQNQLIAYSDRFNQVTFEYDGDGHRISKTVNGSRTDYINDLVASTNQVLCKQIKNLGQKNKKTVLYVYGGSRISQSAEGKTQFYLYDGMEKNVSALINTSGRVLNRYEYTAFGSSLLESQDVPNSYKYCGEQFDKETGLIFLKNRYYDPEIGRFISKDPRRGTPGRPQTFNPYLYADNNPVNFTDLSNLEELPLFADLPTDWNSTDFGLGWSALKNEDEKTIPVKFKISTEHALQTAEVLQNLSKYPLLKNNSTHIVAKALGACEIGPLYSKDLKNAPQVTKLHRWIAAQNNMKPQEATMQALGEIHFPSALDFGGISLSKSEELQLHVADITGASFDPHTGQVIVFGPQQHRLSPLDLDDLAVAIQSIYSTSHSQPVSNLGVSIGVDSSKFQDRLKVQYDGAIANTVFGKTLFEADYLLKNLMIRKNKDPEQEFDIDVPEYSSIPARLAAYECTDNPIDVRIWFVPEQITLVEDDSHQGMVFTDVRMKVFTESKFEGVKKDYPACYEFAEHFTTHFDEFAQQFPVLEKLKQLAKITAIAEWLKNNYTPSDVAFLSNYQPKIAETPEYIAPVVDDYEWILTKIEKQRIKGHKHKKHIPVSYPQITNASGGISYSLDTHNFSTYLDPIANDFALSALQSRPSENVFAWTFSSPTNHDTFMAVAQSVFRTRKPGNAKKNYIDMSFPVPGSQKLSLQRFYNSFSTHESAIGLGWRMTPYELELPSGKMVATSSDERGCETYQVILLKTPEGEYLYTPCTFSEDNCPLFTSSDHPGLLKHNLNGSFSIFIPHVGQLIFNQKGQLLKTSDINNFSIDYVYENSQLSSISHQNETAISLQYEGQHLIKAFGPENTIVHYTYDSNGQLHTVGNGSEIYFYYFYDPSQRLNKIIDHQQNITFEASYDDYNRATFIKDGSTKYQFDFSLENKTMTIVDHHGKETTLRFDTQDRLLQKDSGELTWEFIYEQDNIHLPTKIIDPQGNISECRYDESGNPIYFKNPIGDVWRFAYDKNGNLLCQKEPNGRVIWHTYNKDNQLHQLFTKASASFDEINGSLSRNVTLDKRYAASFEYDDVTGQLKNIKNTRNAITSFAYDHKGVLEKVFFPTGYSFKRKTDEKGRIRETSDSFGLQKRYEYDGDLLKSIQTPMGTIYLTYHEGGHLKQMIDPKGFTTSYEYDSKHNLKEVTDATGGTSSYEYNPLNQLIHISLPNGSHKTMEYAPSGHLTREIWGN